MDRFKVTITAQSPLCFSERRPGGQFRESMEYVPGTVLRGAIAVRMLKDGLESHEAFQQLFMGEQAACFRNAYPASHLLPATAMSCKAESGFRPKGHGVMDTLVEQLCFETLEPAGLLYVPKCSHCGMRMERCSGFYRRDGSGFRAERVTQRLLTRVAINRRRATAEDGLLYSLLVISEGKFIREVKSGIDHLNYYEMTFTGTVISHTYGNVLQSYLKQAGHLGSGASRGLGQVQIEIEQEPVNDEDERRSLRRRRDKLNAAIKEFWDLLKALPGCVEPLHSPDTGTYFTVDLYADAVLKENGWLPAMVLTESMLKDRCRMNDDTLQLVRAYSNYDYRGGWNVAWGLPKDVEVIVPLGSVFVFWTQQPEQWEEALLDLEQQGIGERTAEGFGQVRACDQFHVLARNENPI